MTEYKIRAIETGGTGDLEKVCNDAAKDGWRLVSTNVLDLGALRTRVYLFFARETVDERGVQDAWRERHGDRGDERKAPAR